MVPMNLSAGKRWRRRHREQACGHRRGRRWLDELRGEHGKIYTIICKMDKASGDLLCDSGHSTQSSVTTQRGRMGREVGGGSKREGTYVYRWLIHVDVCQKPHNIVQQFYSDEKYNHTHCCLGKQNKWNFLELSGVPDNVCHRITSRSAQWVINNKTLILLS